MEGRLDDSPIRIHVPQRVVPSVGVAVPSLRIDEVLPPGVDRINGCKAPDLGSVVSGAEVVEPSLWSLSFPVNFLGCPAATEVRGAGAGLALFAVG